MKTLRETIDQLDEISRRGFLQGAGAAAVAGAAGGANAQRNNKLDDPMAVYLMGWCQRVSGWFTKWNYNSDQFKKFPYQKVRNIINQIDLLDAEYSSNESGLDFEKWRKIRLKGMDDAGRFLDQYNVIPPWQMKDHYLFEIYDKLKIYYDKLNNILSTKESVQQGVAEESSPDALAKIDELSK